GGRAFAAGGKVFFGHGLDPSGQPSDYFRAYDPVTNGAPASGSGYPSAPRAYATGFGIGHPAYVGLGLIAPSDEFGPPAFRPTFFYGFDASTGAFVDQPEFPGGMRRDAIAFTIGNVAYVGGGRSVDTIGGTAQFTPVNDLWAY